MARSNGLHSSRRYLKTIYRRKGYGVEETGIKWKLPNSAFGLLISHLNYKAHGFIEPNLEFQFSNDCQIS